MFASPAGSSADNGRGTHWFQKRANSEWGGNSSDLLAIRRSLFARFWPKYLISGGFSGHFTLTHSILQL
jgi:hypothetical protein